MPSISERQIAYATTVYSGTVTATGTGSEVTIRDTSAGVLLQLDVTAAATSAGDTLDVKVQTTIDGTNWIDVAYFTQVLGNGGAKAFAAKISATEPQALFATTTALTAGNVRHFIGDRWRAVWAITDATTQDASFTFSVKALPI